jgi:hypothetical protein
MTIPQHPLNPTWLAIETEVVRHRLIDSWEAAAMKALTTFCEQHPLEVILALAGLFSVVSESDRLWLDRLAHLGHLVDQIPIETIVFSIRCMNALYRLQALQSKGMAQVIDLAQSFQWTVSLRDDQMQDLGEEIGDRDARIG